MAVVHLSWIEKLEITRCIFLVVLSEDTKMGARIHLPGSHLRVRAHCQLHANYVHHVKSNKQISYDLWGVCTSAQ